MWSSRAKEIDHTSPTPLYQQVANDLRTLIEGDTSISKLPSEPEIAQLYGVARGTIRQAITSLVEEGLLVRVHGRGTFVARDTTSSDRL